MAFSGRSASWPQALCSLFSFSWWALCCQQWKLSSWNKTQEKWWCHFTWQKKTDSVTAFTGKHNAPFALQCCDHDRRGHSEWKGLAWAYASLQVSRGEQKGRRVQDSQGGSRWELTASSRITHHVTELWAALYSQTQGSRVCLKSKAKRVWHASPLSGGAHQGFAFSRPWVRFLPCPLYQDNGLLRGANLFFK